MKRDLDLIRNLLLAIEERDGGTGNWVDLVDVCPDVNKRYYHLVRMCEVGYIVGIDRNMPGADDPFLAQTLTWDGHDFLDSVRDPIIWQKTKDGAKAAGGFTFELLRDLAKGLIKTQLKKITGVEI